MNFLGHAVVASASQRAPAFVLGAMLPDLAAMAGTRLLEVTEPDAAAGVTLHHRTDAVFHASPTFGRLVSGATRELSSLGLRRGPARAVAHVGVELLLDGWWVATHGVPSVYRPALGCAPDVEHRVHWRDEASAGLLQRICLRIEEAKLAERYAEPAFVASRMGRVLSRRPRLALRGEESGLVRKWAEAAAHTVGGCGAALFDEVRAGLASEAGGEPAAW